MLNHRPGALTEFRQTHIVVEATGEEPRQRMPCVEVVLSGARTAVREQVCINYGPKGNVELLLYFGFTLPDNKADVAKLPSLRPATEPYCLYAEAGQPVRIPPRMLDEARGLAAGLGTDGKRDVDSAVAEVYGAAAVESEPDWNDMASLLSEETPEGIAGEIGTPLSKENEAQALATVTTALRAGLKSWEEDAMPPKKSNGLEPAVAAMVAEVRESQCRLLRGAVVEADRLTRLLGNARGGGCGS